MGEWVDINALRKNLSFEAVLRRYGVAIRKTGNLHRGPCPLPTHAGKKSAPSFSAKLGHGTWQCYSCDARGHVLQFAARMEGLAPDDPRSIRTVSVSLQREFGTPGAADRNPKLPSAGGPQVLVNPPLDFELKDLEPHHPYLKSRGFLPKTIASFGLGYCRRGYLKDRIAIPLHDRGRLVGYAGRLADDRSVSARTPKYLLPSTRERDGKVLEFRPSLLVYGLNRIRKPVEDIILVRGFPSVWWLSQWGFPPALSLVGDSCCPEQGKLIADSLPPNGQAWILGGSSPAERAWAASLLREVSPNRWTRWIRLAKGTPLDCTPGDLEKLFR